MLFNYLQTMIFYSGVQAELKAQINNQDFVNLVCQTNHSKGLIVEEMFPNRRTIPGPKKMRYFIVVCEVLSQKLLLKDIGLKEQKICAELLSDRISKLNSDPFISDIYKAKIDKWKKSIEYFQFNEV